MTNLAPLDIISMNTEDEQWPPLVVLLRDFRDQPGWICINSKTAQIERVYDFIEYQYRNLGRVATHHGHVSTNALQKLLARAVW